jgi:hypothetical protein
VEDSSGSAAARPGPVRRLTFEYDGDQVRLVSDQTVTMIVPAAKPPPAAAPGHGTLSVLMSDEADQPLTAVTRESPFTHDTEVFAPPDEGTLQRVPVAKPKGAFTILVPDHPAATKVELIGRPLRPESHAQPPQSLGTFPLRPPGGE